jgi:putative oxidoreductase
MTSRLPMHLLLLALRLVLGAVFVYAAVTKLPNMQQFAEETANYRLLPAGLVAPLASCLVGVEVLAGLALVVGLAVRGAAAIAFALLCLFIAALSQALLRGIDLRCGCFGGTELASWSTVGRDVLLLAACVPLLWRGGGPFALGELLARRARSSAH